MRHAGRITAGVTPDDLGAEPAGPHRELLDRRGAERVARSKHDSLAVPGEQPRQLRNRGGLARSVDPRDEDHRGPGRGRRHRRPGLLEPAEELPPDRIDHDLGVDHTGPQPLPHVDDDRLGRGRPHVGADERGAKFLQKLLVDEPTFSFEEVADVGVEHPRGLGESGPQPVEQPTAGPCGRLRRGSITCGLRLRRRFGSVGRGLAAKAKECHRETFCQEAAGASSAGTPSRSASSRPRMPATNRGEASVP